MKIKKSQLRKIILESLLVEAISVAQAEEKFKKEKMKAWKSMIFVMKRDGVDAIKAAAGKYDYSKNQQSEWDRDDPFETKYYDGIPYGVEYMTDEELFTNIDAFVPVDVADADRSNSILWLIKQFKSDLGLFFAVTEEEEVIENHYGNLGEVNLINKIRNNLERFAQFKHLINPPEKRDLFRIKDIQELFSIMTAHESKIDAENERLGARMSAENVVKGFIPLRGGLNIVGGNIIQKNPETGFYTKPDSKGFVVGEIHSKQASVKLGSGTDWCTAAPGLDYFKTYYKGPEDPLYYIEDNGKRYQFSYGAEQFMDKDDNPIGDDLIEKYSYILKDLLIKRDGSIQNEKLAKYLLSILGKDPNATVEELDELSKHKSHDVRINVGFNKSTSKKTLEYLSDDENESVRMSVASNSSTSKDTLAKLSNDKDMNVRYMVAGNTATALETIISLYEKIVPDDPVSRGIAGAVASNRSTTSKILRKIFTNQTKDDRVNIPLSGNPATPIDILLQIVRSNNSTAKKQVEKNPTYVEYKKSQDSIQERWMKIAGLLN